jgi:hypothetical protein
VPLADAARETLVKDTAEPDEVEEEGTLFVSSAPRGNHRVGRVPTIAGRKISRRSEVFLISGSEFSVYADFSVDFRTNVA